MYVNEKRGSLWRKWDLHIHAPGTKSNNRYGKVADELWRKFIDALEASDVHAFGIADYFSFDGYLSTVEHYRKHSPTGTKVLIPNIEFRLTETVSTDGSNVHSHVLFDPEQATGDKLRDFLSGLDTHLTDSGRRVHCGALEPSHIAKATVSIQEVRKSLDRCFSADHWLILTATGGDGLRGTAKNSQRSKSISDELDRASHGFFGKSGSTEYYLGKNRYEGGSESEPKPVFDASDAHSLADLDRLSGDEPNYQSTWIKADLTFRGLRQTVFEPRDRVYIGDRPPVLVRQEREATRFIDRLKINPVAGHGTENGKWFRNVDIPFNPELTAIIGNKGSGKSAVADILALLGETRQTRHFSFLTATPDNRKFRRPGYADKFNADLTWMTGVEVNRLLSENPDENKPEAVKYLPQRYFESLTNEIEVQELRREIEDVVFSHVDDSETMGAANFRELEEKKTSSSKQEVSALKTKLRELNIKIVDLEEQSAPAFRAKLAAELEARKAEVRALEASKPREVPPPATESPEQKVAADKIARAAEQLAKITQRGNRAAERLGSLKTDVQELTDLSEKLASISKQADLSKESLRERCTARGFDIDKLVSVVLDLSPVSDRIAKLLAEIEALEKDNSPVIKSDTNFTDLSSVPDLRAAHSFVANAITVLREELSAPQQRYQKYIQAMREIAEKIGLIQGDPDSRRSGTIVDLEERLSRIDDDVTRDLSAARGARGNLCKEIFDGKKSVRTFYEGLKTKVEARLAVISAEDFPVSISASFVPTPGFSEELFSHLNRNVTGPFRGVLESARGLQQRISAVNWNDFPGVLALAEKIVADIQADGIEKQIRDVKKFYDFLFSFEYFEAKYELRLDDKDLNQLSPGEKGLLLLVFYLHLDRDRTPLIIDQPEDNLDNDSIFAVLARCIREAKKTRQVVLVTHNPNLAIGADAEQILHVSLNKAKNYEFSYTSGAIENPSINDLVIKVLEGTRPAFVRRRLKYQIE